MTELKKFKKDQLMVKIFDKRESMGEKAAADVGERMIKLLESKKYINMVFAAAPSQNEFLEALVNYKGIDWSRVNAFHLDEYLGLDEKSPKKFAHFLNKKIFKKVNFNNVYYIDIKDNNIEDLILRYSKLLKNNPLDIACIGIGENGHIAFNDPHVANFADPNNIKKIDLDEKSRKQQVHDNCFDKLSNVPKKALTMTIPAIISANYIYCIVPDENKKEAVYKTIKKDIDTACPASILRSHQRSILYLDKQASELL
jgi:glucosamine-6-phosphate deaminase